ncbi:MAG: site-2 protease family protein [Chloroflexi bacterium]|nr:site-2 protease family protein [Chloroflexota bacterium]
MAQLIALSIAFVVAIDIHEFSHAWVAAQLGDSTARSQGRLTLDPRAHLDPLGTLMIYVAGFGWGKPVPVNPWGLRRGPKEGMAIVSLAGPVSNLLLATLLAIPIRLGVIRFSLAGMGGLVPTLSGIIVMALYINIILAVFNLIPISPLDGFKVAVGLLPEPWSGQLARYEQKGPIILLGLIMVDYILPFSILGTIMGLPVDFLMRLIVGT